tara:strand:- start:678 stop:1451 length:774 start_codon:yes stop_codon:yes gene_type:complete
MNSKILLSNIVHQRFVPFNHKLKYNVPSLFLNLSELDNISKENKLFSINSFNLFSFYASDHGYRDNRSIKQFINENLHKFKITYKNLDVKILCFPRILGYSFNPLSIIYCFDGEKLISIFYEVKNTSNEQHTYIFKGNEYAKEFKLSHKCRKLFYVSPFIKMEAHYQFINKIFKDKININIDLFDNNNNKVLSASQYGKFIELNFKNMFKFLSYNPLFGFKVMFGILYEALRIIFKGGKYYSRKKKLNDTISYEGYF